MSQEARVVPVFIVPDCAVRPRWKEAFPNALVVACLADVPPGDTAASLWLDLATVRERQRAVAVRQACIVGGPVIAMVGVPDEREAFTLLQAGARGYAHVEAAPAQLREIALVTAHSGFWMPPELTQSLLALSLGTVTPTVPASVALDELTAREQMVAEQVARGASNREIATALTISERTVKAHLTAIFEKLGLRDRVQLALAMNNRPAGGV